MHNCFYKFVAIKTIQEKLAASKINFHVDKGNGPPIVDNVWWCVLTQCNMPDESRILTVQWIENRYIELSIVRRSDGNLDTT